jgi:hypothetical protein
MHEFHTPGHGFLEAIHSTCTGTRTAVIIRDILQVFGERPPNKKGQNFGAHNNYCIEDVHIFDVATDV